MFFNFIYVMAILGAILLALPASAQQRLSITSAAWVEGSANLNALRRGVGVMMGRNTAARDTAYWRRSWQFWANIHGHFGEDCAGTVTEELRGVRPWTPRTQTERDTWCSCIHREPGFLTWHRIALAHFEDVLQQAAGAPNLRLPFWDVTANPRLPAQFRVTTYVDETGRRRPNPLYIANRAGALNDGTAQISAAIRNPSDAMRATTFTAFATRLENNPHGGVHSAIGGGAAGYMSHLSTAGMDPIFWLHHANMDRLWECWREGPNGARTPASVLDDVYRFVNGAGAGVASRVSTSITVEQLSYSYGAGSNCASAASTIMASAPTPTNSFRLRLERAVPHDAGTGVFEVWLVKSNGQRARAGTISFFGADHHGTQTFDLNIAEAAARLGVSEAQAKALRMEVLPTTGLEAVGR